MKRILFTLLITLIALASSAQSWKLMVGPFEYQIPPSNPLQGNFKTYSIYQKTAGFAGKQALAVSSVQQNFLDLNGYEYLDKQGDFEIRIAISGGAISSKNLEEYEVDVRRGDSTVKEKRYQYRVRIKMYMYYEIVDGVRQTMRSETVYSLDKDRITVVGRDSKSLAELDYNYNRTIEKSHLFAVSASLKNGYTYIGNKLKDELTYRYKYEASPGFTSIKKGEKYGIEGFTESFPKIKEMVKAGELHVSQEEARLKMAPFLRDWERLSNEFDPGQKKEQMLYFAVNYSLSRMYAYLGLIEKAEFYYDRIAQMESKRMFRAYSKIQKNLIDEMKPRMEAVTSKKTLFVDRYDITGIQERLETIANQEAAKEKLSKELQEKVGTLTLKSGEWKKGIILPSYNSAGLLSNLRLRDLEDTTKLTNYNPDKVAGVKLETIEFEVRSFPLSNGQTFDMLEVVKRGKGISLYQYTNQGVVEFLLLKHDLVDIPPVNLMEMKALDKYPEALTTYVSACLGVKMKAKLGHYQLRKDDLIQLVEDYDGCD
ncbi:MAG: hypothetical protein AAFY71_14375 [Bacteroidota bacterium]